jgi:hypothetical protein
VCKPLTKEQRDIIANNLGEPRWPGSMIDARMALTRMEHWLRQYEATVAALEAENARLRPLAEVGEFAVDERRAYKRYMAGEYGDWLEKRNAARQGVWDTADAILAQEEGGE